MTTSTSGTYIFQAQAAMLRICMGCILCSLIFKMHGAHAAQPENELLAPGLDLVAVKFAYRDINQQPVYTGQQSVKSINTSFGFFDSTDTSSGGFGLLKASRLPDYIEENASLWVAKILWHLTSVNDRASLSPQLRIESKDTLIEIKQVDRSVWMVWHKSID